MENELLETTFIFKSLFFKPCMTPQQLIEPPNIITFFFHTVAIGVTGEPTAPGNLKGGADKKVMSLILFQPFSEIGKKP